MEVHVESPGGLHRQMRVRVPAERVAKAVDERLKRYASRAKLPGFRPGKAPRKVVEQQFGEAARIDAISDIVQQTYPEAISQAGVNPAGQPKIDITAEKTGEALEYVAHFEVYPEIKLQALEALKIEKPVVEVSEADIDKLVENLRKARREFAVVERAAAAGDRVKIDFLGKLDGEAFAGGEGKDVSFEIGASQFLPDLENGVVGHRAGEQFIVDVRFPADYRAENLRGRTAQFEVNLKSVEEAKLPEIDAEFLKSHGVEDGGGVAALRAKCKAALEKERDKGVQNRLKAQALDQLLAANPIEVPDALIQQEIPRMRQEAAARMNVAKLDADRLKEMLPDAVFEPQARRRVSLGLLIGEVIKSRQIKLDPARLDKALDNMAADYEQPDQVKAFYRARPDLMQGLGAMVLEDQVVDALVAGGTVSDKSMTLDELLNPQAAAKA
ncbi:trigger factor [Fontimonas sp. SYSU GA230001]|uniref:trigger factor n=1 Tax=Fontimonas sp. SYSU GA230001 TaxID=3142450 RepID=UPI0032B5D0E0